jgi:hypothetical protein
MTANVDIGRRPAAGHRQRAERREARLLFCAVYPFCLAFALAARLKPRGNRSSSGRTGGRKSVFKEARASAASCIPFAFR